MQCHDQQLDPNSLASHFLVFRVTLKDKRLGRKRGSRDEIILVY